LSPISKFMKQKSCSLMSETLFARSRSFFLLGRKRRRKFALATSGTSRKSRTASLKTHHSSSTRKRRKALEALSILLLRHEERQVFSRMQSQFLHRMLLVLPVSSDPKGSGSTPSSLPPGRLQFGCSSCCFSQISRAIRPTKVRKVSARGVHKSRKDGQVVSQARLWALHNLPRSQVGRREVRVR